MKYSVRMNYSHFFSILHNFFENFVVMSVTSSADLSTSREMNSEEKKKYYLEVIMPQLCEMQDLPHGSAKNNDAQLIDGRKVDLQLIKEVARAMGITIGQLGKAELHKLIKATSVSKANLEDLENPRNPTGWKKDKNTVPR